MIVSHETFNKVKAGLNQKQPELNGPSMNATTKPQERLVSAFGRFFIHVNNLQVFYATTSDLLDVGKSHVEEKILKKNHEELAKPEVHQLLGADNPLLQDKALFNFVNQALARRSVRLSGRIVGSTTIVFAHSVLDALVSECCLASFEANPLDWHRYVKSQKVELGKLETEGASALLNQRAYDYVCQLRRESIVKRLSLLNAVCIPKLSAELKPKITKLLNTELLERFDGMRHQIIHDKPFTQTTSDIQEELFLVLVTGLAAFLTVGNAYGLVTNEKSDNIPFYKKMLEEVQDDLPELKGMIGSLTKVMESLNQLTELIRNYKIPPKE